MVNSESCGRFYDMPSLYPHQIPDVPGKAWASGSQASNKGYNRSVSAPSRSQLSGIPVHVSSKLTRGIFHVRKESSCEEFFDSGAIFPINKLQTRRGDFNSNGRKG